MQLSPACSVCDAFLAQEAAAGRTPQLGHLHSLGAAVVIPQGYPDAHYGFRAAREGNECPTCRRRIVSIEDGPRSQGWKTYLELRSTRTPAAPPPRPAPRAATPAGGLAAPRLEPKTNEWTLVSVAGPTRWRMGRRERRARQVAARDGETLRVPLRDTVLSFGEDGLPRAAPLRLGHPLALSGDGRRAAAIEQRQLRVVELASGATALSMTVPRRKAALSWSHDGTTLSVDGAILRVATGELVAQLPGTVLALSNDGSLAIVRRGAGELVVMDRDGRTLRRVPGAAHDAWQFAWSGRACALVSPNSTALVDLDDPARDLVIEGLGGHALAIDSSSGRFLVGGEHGAGMCALGRPPLRFGEVSEPFVIAEDTRSAIVWVGARLERLDLDSGARWSVGDETPAPICALVADPLGEGVFVGAGSSDAFLWDPQSERRLRALPPMPGLCAITEDGTSLLCVDDGGHVALVTRDGASRWTTQVADPPAIEASDRVRLCFEEAGVHRIDAQRVVVHVTFSETHVDSGEDAPPRRHVHLERVLGLEGGARQAEAHLPRPSVRPRLELTMDRDRVIVAGATAPLTRELGDVTATLLSSDGRGLLVGTALGLIARLTRA